MTKREEFEAALGGCMFLCASWIRGGLVAESDYRLALAKVMALYDEAAKDMERYIEFYEASRAFQQLPWYKDGRNNDERESASDRVDDASEAIEALRAEKEKVG